MEVQSSDLSLSKIVTDKMLQESINFTDFKIVRCLEIDMTTLKFNTITLL